MADADPTTPRTAGRGPAATPASAQHDPPAASPPTQAASLAPGAAGAGDVALIAACTELCDAQERLDVLLCQHPAYTLAEERAQAPLADALHARVTAALRAAIALPASTAAGLVAKGRAALAVGEKDFEGRNVADDDPARLMLAAVQDLVSLLGVAATGPVTR